MFKKQNAILATLLLICFSSTFAFADDSTTTKEKAKDEVSQAEKVAKKDVRAAKDKTCEMIDGKMQCFGKKMKHKAEDIKDDMSK